MQRWRGIMRSGYLLVVLGLGMLPGCNKGSGDANLASKSEAVQTTGQSGEGVYYSRPKGTIGFVEFGLNSDDVPIFACTDPTNPPDFACLNGAAGHLIAADAHAPGSFFND